MKASKLLHYTAIACLALALLYTAYTIMSKRGNKPPALPLADTPILVSDVRPSGQLYLYTVVTEDFAEGTFMGSGYGSSLLGKGNGILKKRHKCVQILRQQVSFTIDLDQIVYESDTLSDTIWATLPSVQFEQSTLHPWFKSDDEDEEGIVNYDASALIHQVEQKIRRRYDTPYNRTKARQKAEAVLREFFGQCGKTVVFR